MATITATLNRASVLSDRVRAEASTIDLVKVLIFLLTGLFIVVGWIAYKVFAVLAAAARLVAGAVVVGWKSAQAAGSG